MKILLEVEPENNSVKTFIVSPVPLSRLQPVPLDPPIPSPPTTPEPGLYVRGTEVKVINGVTTLEELLFKLPDPGGTLGWTPLNKSFYTVPV